MFEKYWVTIFPRFNLVAETGIPSAAVVGIVAYKNIHVRINDHIINIAETVRIYFHFCTVRSYPHNAATQHGDFSSIASFRIVKTKITHSDIYPSIYTQANSVGSMIRSTTCEISRIAHVPDECFGRPVSKAIIVFVFINIECHSGCDRIRKNGVKYIQLVAYGYDTARIVNLCIFCMPVNNSIVVTIYQFYNSSLTGLFTKGTNHIYTNIDFS